MLTVLVTYHYFLGLRFLTVIDKCCQAVRNKNPDFSEETIPLDDEKTYKMLSLGKGVGLFQLESEGMRSLLTRIEPRSLDDITVAISLYRPGPARFIEEYLANRKNPSGIKYSSPLLAPVLDSTYGCMIYQEQVMRICVSVAGYSYGKADLVRRAMAKKNPEAMQRERGDFVKGARSRGMDEKEAEALFDSIAGFATYAFNKSHAAAYAVLAYRTAYLKCHYPREYMAALLNSVMGDNNKIRLYRQECLELGFDILPPHINKSGVLFSVEEGGVRFGLAAIKNVGESFAKQIVKKREAGGNYTDLEDYLMRITGGSARMSDSLIRCGAMDCFGRARSVLVGALDTSADKLSHIRQASAAGQIGLFEAMGDPSYKVGLDYPRLDEFPTRVRLEEEKALTGLYLTGHPLAEYKAAAKSALALSTAELSDKYKGGSIKEGQSLTLLGMIKESTQKQTKNGGMMAFCVLEDMLGEIELVVFPRQLSAYGSILGIGSIVCVAGKLSVREAYGDENEDELKLIVDTVNVPDLNAKDLYIKVTEANEKRLEEALAFLAKNRGSSRVCVYYQQTAKLYSPKGLAVSVEQDVTDKLRSIMGDENIALKQRSK